MQPGLFTPRSASLPLFISAVLHILAFLVEGFTAFASAMFVIGLVYASIAYGLRKDRR